MCKHMKDVRSSQPCISMNFWTELSSSMWVSLAMSPAMCVHLVTMPLKSSYKLSSNKFGPPTFFIIFSLSPLAFFFSELIVLLLKTYLEYLIFRFLIDEPISKCLACLLTFIVKLLWTDLVLFTSSVNNRKFYFLSSVYSFFNVSQINPLEKHFPFLMKEYLSLLSYHQTNFCTRFSIEKLLLIYFFK